MNKGNFSTQKVMKNFRLKIDQDFTNFNKEKI